MINVIYEVVEVTNIRGEYLDDWDETPICWFSNEYKAKQWARELERDYPGRTFNASEIWDCDVASPHGKHYPKA